MAIHVVGVNPAGYEAGNAAVCDGRDLPWLQETADDDVWGDWNVTYRDVVILDRHNQVVRAYNLSEHNLAISDDYAELKAILRERASAP